MSYHNSRAVFWRNFSVFLFGAVLSCLIIRHDPPDTLFSSGIFTTRPEIVFDTWPIKALFLLFLCAFLPFGPVLIPLLVGVEGMLLGAVGFLAFSSCGIHGLVSLMILLASRLLLVIPFLLLLSTWGVGKSLSFGTRFSSLPVLVAVLVVLTVSTVWESNFGPVLSNYYYLQFGV